MDRTQHERGETLVEVVISIILIGIVASAWFVTYSHETKGSTLNQNLATADTVLRSYAESAKAAVRTTCSATTTSFTVTQPRSDFPVTVSPANGDGSINCPGTTTPTQLTVTTTFNGTQQRTLQFDVRKS